MKSNMRSLQNVCAQWDFYLICAFLQASAVFEPGSTSAQNEGLHFGNKKCKNKWMKSCFSDCLAG